MLAILAAASVFQTHGLQFTITSISVGQHGAKSKHLVGCAVDIRTREIGTPELQELIVDEIRDALTNNYDVIPEKTHLHIEWDPK